MDSILAVLILELKAKVIDFSMLHSPHYIPGPAAVLSALFKVDAARRRVGDENDYIYYAGNRGIHKIRRCIGHE